MAVAGLAMLLEPRRPSPSSYANYLTDPNRQRPAEVGGMASDVADVGETGVPPSWREDHLHREVDLGGGVC